MAWFSTANSLASQYPKADSNPLHEPSTRAGTDMVWYKYAKRKKTHGYIITQTTSGHAPHGEKVGGKETKKKQLFPYF
jgi:hypothetical protein